MKWISKVVVDLFALAFIIVLSVTKIKSIYYVVLVYSALLLFGRIFYLFIPLLKQKSTVSDVPHWFYHLNYALTVLLLAVSGYHYLLGIWTVIWILAFASNYKK